MRVVQSIRDDLSIAYTKLRQFTHLVVLNRGWLSDADVQKILDAGYQQSYVLAILLGVTQKALGNYTNHLAKTPLGATFTEVAC